MEMGNSDNSLCICGTDDNRMAWIIKHMHIDELIKLPVISKKDEKNVGGAFKDRFLPSVL